MARMALKINLINDQRCYVLPKGQLNDLCVFILKSQGIKNTEVNILFTDNERIRKLNKKFRKKNKATDVLSFCEEKNKARALSCSYLGDVAISVETARQESKMYHQSIIGEIRLYIVHGLLHLLGYRDYTKKEKQSMNFLQETLLSKYEKKNNS